MILHKGIGNGHGGDYHNVHEQRHNDNVLVEANQFVVLAQTVVDEVSLNGLQKVPIKNGIDDEV